MADTPKATKMTLEEAVEIVRHGYDGHVFAELRRNENASPSDLMAEWDRARAIVDQAVVFSKAYTKLYENYEYGDGKVLEYEWKKLRALERGESEGKP